MFFCQRALSAKGFCGSKGGNGVMGITINTVIIVLTISAVLLLVVDFFVKRKLIYDIKRAVKEEINEPIKGIDMDILGQVGSIKQLSVKKPIHLTGAYINRYSDKKRFRREWLQRIAANSSSINSPAKIVIKSSMSGKEEIFVINLCTEKQAERRIIDLAESGYLDKLSEKLLRVALTQKSSQDYSTILNNLEEAMKSSTTPKANSAISRLAEICTAARN